MPTSRTQAKLAERMGMSPQELNPIIRGKRGISARTALLLGKALDTTPQFWMNLQAAMDLWVAQERLRQ